MRTMEQIADSTVMVTGGAGFVGSAIVRELLAIGARVVVYDNYLHGDPRHLQGLDETVVVIEGDVLESPRLEAAMGDHGVRYLINCVGDTFVPDAYEVPERFFEVNLLGNLSCLRAAGRCGLERMVYVSSTEVYGAPADTTPIHETLPYDPVNTYAVSKLAADRLCATYCVEHQVPVIIARIFNCYGPRETHPYIVPDIIAQLSRSNVLRLGNIAARRDLTYVHDTATALIALLGAPVANGTAVNVGSNRCWSVEWLAHAISDILGVTDIEIEIDPARLRRRDIDWFQCDNRLLRASTGWQPTVPIHEGLTRTVAWYREHGSQWSFESS